MIFPRASPHWKQVQSSTENTKMAYFKCCGAYLKAALFKTPECSVNDSKQWLTTHNYGHFELKHIVKQELNKLTRPSGAIHTTHPI